jgi:hypothetical protein
VPKRYTSEEAIKLVMERGFSPIGPYPGAKGRWKAKHIDCGGTVFITLNSVRNPRKKLGVCINCAANSATVTINTTGAQAQYVPQATTTSTGGILNVDNRYQTVTVSSSAGVVAGDAFTIDGIEAVHHITKRSTGELKTFRVISVPAGGTTLVISPPIIAATAPATDAELQYKNVELVAAASAAPLNFLNTTASNINPFWRKDSIELLPGRYAVPDGAGVDVLRASTDQGIELVMTKRFDPLTFQTLYTLDTLYGVVMTNPEMAGILLFNQA